MGFYSSWALMALTHHVLVRLAALKVNKFYFKDYMVLGDDVVIANQDVAHRYQLLITSIGINISRVKSVVSQPGYSSREFASKWVLNGIDVSPIPSGLLLEGRLFSLFRLITYLYNWTLEIKRFYDQQGTSPLNR
jgi:hypothetical protein